jgi:riboflavin transporter FmnP
MKGLDKQMAKKSNKNNQKKSDAPKKAETANTDATPKTEKQAAKPVETPKKAEPSASMFDTKKLVTMAMLCAVAYVVMYIVKTATPPIVSIPGLSLQFDPKDVVILFGAFLYGPIAGVLMSVVVSTLEMLTISTSGWVGLVMNIVSTCAFILPASIVYRRRKTLGSAVIGLGASVVSVTAVMVLWNYLLVPVFTPAPRAVVVSLLLPVFVPFNLFKGTLNAVLTVLLYKPLVTGLYHAKLIQTKPAVSDKKATSQKLIFIIAATIAIVGFLVWLRYYHGVLAA